MKVYHGSWMEVSNPDLKHSRPDVDFGRGFYVTPNWNLARNIALRATAKERGMKDSFSVVMRFEYTEDLKLNYKRFEIENMEWACFIIANRVTERIADELGLKDRNLDGRYDIVIGGTADGVVANVASKLRYGKIKLQDYQLKMEDFLKFLLIAGVILVGIFKEVNKNSKSKKAKNNRPVPPTPSPVEVAPDATPMPEAWGRPRSLEELFQPIPAEQRTRKPKVRQQESKPKKKKEEVSVAASIANSAAQDERNSRQGAHYNTSHDSHDNKEDFTIHSAEEARRAIIWGEILQRKY